MVSFPQAVITCMKTKLLKVEGRAPRSEFWWFILFSVLASLVLNILLIVPFLGAIIMLVGEVWLLIASITVTARRLHDRDLSGWWMLAPYALMTGGLIAGFLVALVFPDIGSILMLFLTSVGALSYIVLLVVLILKGTEGPNRFGPDPLTAFELPHAAASEGENGDSSLGA